MTKMVIAAILLGCLVSNGVQAGIILSNATPTVTQDFNSLTSTGTTGSTLPGGWQFIEIGSAANSTYGVGTGSSTTGNTYSFGLTSDSDRALGGLRSGTLTPLFGASFQNGGTTILQDLSFNYFGEQWRVGAANRLDRLDFQYSLTATSLTTGTWTDLDALDFTMTGSPTVGAVNGNLAGNRQNLSAVLAGVNIAVGDRIWIRWSDFDAVGFDDGLAVDDFQITATFALASVPEPGTCMTCASLALLAWRRRRTVHTAKAG